MNSACPRRVSLIIAGGLPAIPSPTICVLSGTVPAVAGLPCRFRLRLLPADSPTHADRIEFTCLCLSRICYGLVVLVPLLSTPHYCDAVTVRYRTVLHRTGADFHRSIFLPFQAHWKWPRCGHSGAQRSVRAAESVPRAEMSQSCASFFNAPALLAGARLARESWPWHCRDFSRAPAQTVRGLRRYSPGSAAPPPGSAALPRGSA